MSVFYKRVNVLNEKLVVVIEVKDGKREHFIRSVKTDPHGEEYFLFNCARHKLKPLED